MDSSILLQAASQRKEARSRPLTTSLMGIRRRLTDTNYVLSCFCTLPLFSPNKFSDITPFSPGDSRRSSPMRNVANKSGTVPPATGSFFRSLEPTTPSVVARMIARRHCRLTAVPVICARPPKNHSPGTPLQCVSNSHRSIDVLWALCCKMNENDHLVRREKWQAVYNVLRVVFVAGPFRLWIVQLWAAVY